MSWLKTNMFYIYIGYPITITGSLLLYIGIYHENIIAAYMSEPIMLTGLLLIIKYFLSKPAHTLET